MIATLLIVVFLYYAWKKGIDYYFMIASACFLYFYPIVVFEDILFIADEAYLLPVTTSAKACIFFGIVFLLLFGLLLKPASYSALSYTRRVNFYANTAAFFTFILMLIIIYENGFGLHGRSKTEVMENLGYAYKLFNISGIIVMCFAFTTMKPKLLILSVAIACFDMMYGFRGGMAELVTIYFLTRPSRPGFASIRLLLLGFLAMVSLIIIKESAYFAKGIGDTTDAFLGLYEVYGSNILSAANAESSGISAVFNQVVTNDFSVSPMYLVDSLVTIFPFMNALGYDAVTFASYFKGVIFGSEGDSFASGILPVGYALASYLGVAICFVGLALFGYVYKRYSATSRPLTRVLLTAFSAVLVITSMRSDLILIFGMIRSLALWCALLYLLYCTANYFSRTSKNQWHHHKNLMIDKVK
jgi:hypothetical protein